MNAAYQYDGFGNLTQKVVNGTTDADSGDCGEQSAGECVL